MPVPTVRCRFFRQLPESRYHPPAWGVSRHDIPVNSIAPGYFITELNREHLEGEQGEKLKARIPTRRFGEYPDLDGPLLLLASDAGRHMTGTEVVVDGGHLVSAL